MKLSFSISIFLISFFAQSQINHFASIKINQIKPCIPNSLGNIASVNSFLVYPSPSDGKINIQHEEKIQEIQIFDLTGKRIFQQKFNSNAINLELNNIPNGIYIVFIKTETQTLKQKIIINHD
jgi:hypothetical protein